MGVLNGNSTRNPTRGMSLGERWANMKNDEEITTYERPEIVTNLLNGQKSYEEKDEGEKSLEEIYSERFPDPPDAIRFLLNGRSSEVPDPENNYDIEELVEYWDSI